MEVRSAKMTSRGMQEQLIKFGKALRDKLLLKERLGFTGWEVHEEDYLIERMQKNIYDKDWVDVANIAFLLWLRRKMSERPSLYKS